MNLGSSRRTHLYNKPIAEKTTGNDSSRILVNIKDVGQQLDDSLYKREKYVIYSIGIGNLLNKKVPGTLSAMFSYTSKDISTGITTPQTFNGHFKDPFSPNIYLLDLLNLEIVSKKHFFDIGAGINSNQYDKYSPYFKFGYGHIFPINLVKWHNQSILLFKPSMGILYMDGARENLGSIDNNNKVINLLGYTADNQFSVHYDYVYYGTDKTYNASRLAVDFSRSIFMLAPKISISNKLSNRLYWSIDASWLLQISNYNRFYLNQEANDNGGHLKTLAEIKPGTNGLTTMFNGIPFTKGPSLSGAYIGVNVGMCLAKKTRISPNKKLSSKGAY
jgi:hypothetical protein